MTFEMYKGYKGALRDELATPKAFLTSHSIVFNPAAVKQFLLPLAKRLDLDNIRYVKLGYDAELDVIGMWPIASKSNGSLRLTPAATSYGCTISAKGLILHFQLQEKRWRAFAVEIKSDCLHLKFTDQAIKHKAHSAY